MANPETSKNDFFSSRKFMNYFWTFNDRFNFPQFIKIRSVPDCLPFVRDVLVNKRFKIDIRNFEKKKKVQVGKDQEKAQSEKDSHSKNRTN